MKTLYLLRHAHAEFSPTLNDIDRTLSREGIATAKALGETMRGKQQHPSFVYCSPAKRTSMTLDALSLNAPAPNQDPKLYLGTAGDYLNFLQQISEDHSSALLIGHNPSIHEIVRFLSQNSNDIRLLSYAPCTLTILSVTGSWKDLSPSNCILHDIL